MKVNQELALLREFFSEWCQYENNVEAESNCKTWDEAKHLYPLMDAYWKKVKKLRKQILKAQATISVVRGKNKKARKPTPSKGKK